MKSTPKRRVNFSRPRFNLGILAPIKSRAITIYRRTITFVEGRPFTAFLVMLAILLLLIAGGNQLQKPKPTEEPKKEPINVDVYRIGVAPKITVSGHIIKSKTVKITAQAPGVIQQINTVEGQQVNRGQTLISTSTNYQGGNAASAARELASRQYQNAVDSFNTQKDLINRQRDIANTQRQNVDDLRNIANQSLSDTRNAVDLNNDILGQINTNLQTLENNNVSGANDALILQTKQLKAQLLAGNNQLKAGIRQQELQTDTSKSPTQIADIQKDIALKQLDLQEKALNLGKDVALIQLKIAQINEATMFPAAPYTATVEKVYVRIGQSVSPGTPLMEITGDNGQMTAVVEVPGNIARSISQMDPSFVIIGGKKIEVSPLYISKEATNGQLYHIDFPIEATFQTQVADGEFVPVDITVGYANTSSTDPFVPIDAVFLTQDQAIVYTVENNKATAKKVELGQVLGSDIEVVSGLANGAQIIINRNIVAGDPVKIDN